MKDLGPEASGCFQAAWAISMTYVGFVLGEMAADYLPRLTEPIHDRERAKSLVNEQNELALLFAAPASLAMLMLAPWLIELLYVKGITPAAELLRWQVMGDLFKFVGWPIQSAV
jgi:PST family polysaccharide transporter